MKKILIASLGLLISLCGWSQVKWPAISSTTKPWTRWWWPGSAVNTNDLSANLEAYKAAGLGGVEITPIYGVAGYEDQFIDYLSPRWMDMLQHTLREAKRLQLGVDMATGTGWPFGGPHIDAAEACKDFSIRTWTLQAGNRLPDTVICFQEPFIRAVGNQIYELHGIYKTEPTKGSIAAPLQKAATRAPDINTLKEPVSQNENLQALALDQVKFRKRMPLQVLMGYSDKGDRLDLTRYVDEAGVLQWTPSEGNWTLYGLFMGWHGKMVERAAPKGEGNVIDHFSLPALQKYLGAFDKAFAGYDLSGLRGFFNDSYEVDDARGQSNYTPDLLQEFEKRRGYDLRLHLPALIKKDHDEHSLRILHDYRLTLSELLLEKFTIPWQQWAKAKGKLVRNQSHGSPANILDLYGAVDIPETEGSEILRFKFAASAAHVLGKPLVAAEAATWLDEHFKAGLRDVKLLVDKYFLGGVNHIVWHGTSYSPANDPWPGWLFYAAVHFQPTHPFWNHFKALNNYVARCQSFLQSGGPDNDVLLYFPFADKISQPGSELLHHFDGMNGFDSTGFKEVAEQLLAKGVAFDLLSDRQLQQLTCNGSILQAPGGNYKTIILPDVRLIPLESMEQLQALAKNGATILVYKNLPADVPGFAKLGENRQRFTAIMSSLQLQHDGQQQKAVCGKGAFVLSDDLQQLLHYAAVPQETMVQYGLQCVRRSIGSGKYYFISNTGTQTVNQWVPLATTCQGAYLYDPMLMQAGVARTKTENGQSMVWLQLQPGQSCIVQTSTKEATGKAYMYIDQRAMPQTITGNWSLQFISGGPALPADVVLPELKSWTTLEDTAAHSFSGTAAYTMWFAKPETAGNYNAFLLDLGKVEQSAEVWLNRKRIATLIGPLYQVTIPAADLRENNLLEVRVSNSMTNRIICLEKQGMPWKKFYNVNFPARLAANRDANGLFTAQHWQPEPSGLLGPVTLTPVLLSQ